MVNVRKAIDSNAGGTATLLEAVIARREQVRRVVVASSMVVYGEGAYRCAEHGVVMPGVRPVAQLRERRWEPLCPRCGRDTEPVPLTEDKPLQPISVYGISKRDTEELALVLGDAYGFEAVALRYLNVYGPRQALANPYTGVAAIFSSRLLGGDPPRVFEDGRQIRDLVHVSDIVAATMAAMDAPEAPGRAFNVATGRRIGIAELASQLCALLAPDARARDHRRVQGRRHPPLLRRPVPGQGPARLRGRDVDRGRPARAGRVGGRAGRQRVRRRGPREAEKGRPGRLGPARVAADDGRGPDDGRAASPDARTSWRLQARPDEVRRFLAKDAQADAASGREARRTPVQGPPDPSGEALAGF